MEKIGFYRKHGLSDRCVQEQEDCSISPYPGCDLSKKQSNPSANENQYLSHFRYPRQGDRNRCRDRKCGCDGQCISSSRVLRSADDSRRIIRIDRIIDWRNINKQRINPRQYFDYSYQISLDVEAEEIGVRK